MADSNGTNKDGYKVIGTRPIRHDGLEKVTGQAKYGADLSYAGMLFGKIVRSPHAHARIRSINFDQALKVPGVHAVVTGADLPDLGHGAMAQVGELVVNTSYLSQNVLARGKVLYDGHAVAAVRSTRPHIARRALGPAAVRYEILPSHLTVGTGVEPAAPSRLPAMPR